MTLDIIESKIYNPPASIVTKTKLKNLIKLHFVNKDIDMININKIINDKNVRKTYLHNSAKQNKFNSIYIN